MSSALWLERFDSGTSFRGVTQAKHSFYEALIISLEPFPTTNPVIIQHV
jgi:hypothetical protein